MQMQSENINELALALSKVQGAIQPAKKDCNNPYYKSKYADLTSVWESCREELSTNQIAVVQGLDDTETHLVVITTLIHSSGQWMKSKMMISKTMAEKGQQKERPMTAQEIGAATTYLRRFSLASVVGVCTEDDDGNIASGKQVEQTKQMQKAATQPVATLTTGQLNILESQLAQVPEYRDKLMVYLKSSQGITDLRYIAPNMYVGIMNEIKKHTLSKKETVKMVEKIEELELANA